MPGWHRRRLKRLEGDASAKRARRDPTALVERLEPRALTCLIAGFLAALWSGPVGGAVVAAYASIVLGVLVRRRRERMAHSGANRAMDMLVTLASQLRAGADPSAVTAGALPAMRTCGAMGARLAARVRVATRVAEASGARLADLLDRLESDARATARAHDLAQAQAAGAEATGWLLAALPIGGIALGTGIGAHPLHGLLHTPLGAACVATAVALQALGLAWTRHLATSGVRRW